MKNSIKRILCAVICLCMALTLALGMISCNKEDVDGPKEGEIEVVRTKVAMKKGEQITSDKVYIDYVKEENVPLNAIRVLDKVVDKYLTADVVVGDYLFAGKLTASVEVDVEIPEGVAYVSVKDYVTEGEDSADAIQKIIDSNPGRTLYFADGTYLISKPLLISADPAKKVSLDLSNYAVIKAADSWSSGDAMIRFGANDKNTDNVEVGSTSAYIRGGIVDGNGKAKGISVEGGRDNFISNVSVKNTTVGIILGATVGDARTTVENTNITGTFNDASIGMQITSNTNALENVQIDGSKVGVQLTGSNNILRNVHANYDGKTTASIGFEDRGQSNSYDICFAENYAIGFYMGADVMGSVYSGCYTFWNNGISVQTAYACEGTFSSVIRTGRVDFDDASATAAYLTVGGDGGSGKVLWPLIKNVDNIDIKDYADYLAATKVIEIAE